ncbi:glutaredoxin-like protein NrdH [Bifidobacterium pseudolongum subsp. globosum]|uniref:Glutaredoxin-like protein NrdH n=1 Tax=Bifidobacterium pseudolongum subsp. globosum TaxID=1690 RepID=A0A4Q5A210_9BIFI|nr:glutaredoxin domain-containing protein [Bifidobacterium pseudolongum]RYQ11668.1 glutaredoxin-like protein NrdH [Bifidobacterium pseudolongum subsp. globosum]
MTTFTMETTETTRTLHVTVYTKDNCQQCAATERALNRMGLDYREIKITEANIPLLQEAGFTQAPVVMVSMGSELQDFWSGYRPDKIQGLLQ